MRNLSLSIRSRSALVASALMASALLGSSAAQADTCRPWHIEIEAQFSTVQLDADGNLAYGEAVGSGYASHFGDVAVTGTNYFSRPVNGIIAVEGHGGLTADNGDQVFVTFDGMVVDVATGAGTGTYVVTGGTGRFAGATGSAPVSSSPTAGGFSAVADGTLCY